MDSSLVGYLIGSGGAAGVTLVLILLGILVPKSYHDRVLEQAQKLQEANDILAAALNRTQAMNDRLTISGDLTNKLVTALIAVTGQHSVTEVMNPSPSHDSGISPIVPGGP